MKYKNSAAAKEKDAVCQTGADEAAAAKYRDIAITAVVVIVLTILLLGYFGFASLSAPFSRGRTVGAKGAAPAAAPVPLTVIVDAGHGGIDPGAVDNGLVEKQLNLEVALKLRDFLLLSGVEVLMTRTDDSLPGQGETTRKRKAADLEERLKIINAAENCVFVSLHMNKFPSPSAHGVQTFYASASNDARRLAEHIQNQARKLDPSNSRQIKPDGKTIYILENTSKTAVLVECGFLSNKKEASLLATPEYQSRLAFAVYCGIMEFLQET